MPKKTAAFLFGSGISVASGAPRVTELTRSVIDSPWWFHTDEKFYPVTPERGFTSDETAARAQNLIRILHDHITPVLLTHARRTPNYEDYFSCLKQIVQHETVEFINPIISPSIAALKDASSYLHVGHQAHIDGDPFVSLVDRASNLIQWVVFHALQPLSVPKSLDLLSSVASKYGSLNIFSLNHDLLLEQQLKSNRIKFSDGFGVYAGDAAAFTGAWNRSVRIYKLHGSVNWYYMRSRGTGANYYAKVDRNPDRAQGANTDVLSLLEPVPQFLTGTTVKEHSYGFGLFGKLFAEFRRRLQESSTLICSGYGWGDKGINIRIDEWLSEAPANRVILLHGKKGEDLEVSTTFWWNRWKRYKKAGKVIRVPKWFSESTLADLSLYI